MRRFGTGLAFFVVAGLTLGFHFHSRPTEMVKVALEMCSTRVLQLTSELSTAVLNAPLVKGDPESTPMIRALQSECYLVAQRLVDEGLDIDTPYADQRVRSPLHWAIQTSNDRALLWLIERTKTFDFIDYNGDTALSESVIFGNLGAFKTLVAKGALLSPPQVPQEKSPLVQVLVHPDGAWLEAALPALKREGLGPDGWCPLALWLSGTRERSLESVEELIRLGASTSCRDRDGTLAVESALDAQPVAVVKRILTQHPPITDVDAARIDREIARRNDTALLRLFQDWKRATP